MFKYKDELDKLLGSFDIKKDSMCIVASFPLFVYGMQEHGDIDICLSFEEKERIREEYNLPSDRPLKEIVKSDNVHAVNLVGRNQKSFLSFSDISDQELIKNNKYFFYFNNYKVVKLELCYSEKLYRCTQLDLLRPKDIDKIVLIEKRVAENNWDYNWDQNLVVFPGNIIEEVKLFLMRGLFDRLFRNKWIRSNWSYFRLFFDYKKNQGYKKAIKELIKFLK